MPTNDRNILDIITAVNTDLRHTENFRALLHPLDEDTARRVTKHYIELLYRALRPKTGRTITAAAVAPKNSRDSLPNARALFGLAGTCGRGRASSAPVALAKDPSNKHAAELTSTVILVAFDISDEGTAAHGCQNQTKLVQCSKCDANSRRRCQNQFGLLPRRSEELKRSSFQRDSVAMPKVCRHALR